MSTSETTDIHGYKRPIASPELIAACDQLIADDLRCLDESLLRLWGVSLYSDCSQLNTALRWQTGDATVPVNF